MLGLFLIVSVIFNICFLIVCISNRQEAMMPPYDPAKTCAKGWHVWGKWSGCGFSFQSKTCRRCGIKVTRSIY
jgi:hypothetical protein